MQTVQEELVLIKGKRSKRPRPASPLALTMVETSSSTTAELSGAAGGLMSDNISGSSNSTELAQGGGDIEEEEDMANCLILLAKGQTQKPPPPAVAAAANKAAEVNYQCKTCSKSFPSFQALGGHRASHKKPIKPIAVEEKKPPRENSPSKHEDESTVLSLQIPSRISCSTRVHECSICGAEFASGQALGGHMRRHRPMPRVASSNSNGGGESQEAAKRPRNLLSLDLNLPAPEDDRDHRESKFPAFSSKEQVIVFSTSPLVDCHY